MGPALLRALALAAFAGFAAVSVLFAAEPARFNGDRGVDAGSALWHSLSLAFMATVSTLALMIAWDPRRYWRLLLPLAVGKAVSALSSWAWSTLYAGTGFLRLNAAIDGSIAAMAAALYIAGLRGWWD